MKITNLIFAASVTTFFSMSKPVKAQQNRETNSCYESALINFGDCLSKDILQEIPEIPQKGRRGLGSAILGCSGQFAYRTVLCGLDSSPNNNQNNSSTQHSNSRSQSKNNTGSYSYDPYVYEEGYSQDPYATDVDGDGVPDRSYDPYSF